MPDTQPTGVRELARKWFRCPCGTSYSERRDYAGNSPPDDEPHAPEDFDAGVERMTAEIDAYAAERIGEINEAGDALAAEMGARMGTAERERDAALAKLAEAEAIRHESGPSTLVCGCVFHTWAQGREGGQRVDESKCSATTTEERVRVLETAIRKEIVIDVYNGDDSSTGRWGSYCRCGGTWAVDVPEQHYPKCALANAATAEGAAHDQR